MAALAKRLMIERFVAGDEIIHAGDPGDKLYIVQRGQVDVVGRDPLGRPRPLAVLAEGDYFGEMALVHEEPRNATCRARTSVQAYSLSKADFNGLLRSVPALRQMIEQGMAQRATTNAVRTA